MFSDKSTTTFDSEEEQRYLERIQAEIKALSNLCFKLDGSIVPESQKTASILLRLLAYIGARSDDFLREFRRPDELCIGTLAYLGRSIFEAYCILSHLLKLPPQRAGMEVKEQIALDKEELHKNIHALFPPELKAKLPAQLAKWKALKNEAKKWNLNELIKSDPALTELYKKYYPFFNKFAHPTAFSLFCEDDEGALRAARGVYLMMTYKCLIDTTTRFTKSLSKS
jgi:hypothetical protein